MAKKMLTFRFDYSEDGGGTWKETTPVTFSVVRWDVKILNEELVTHVLEDKNKIVSFTADRIVLSVTVDVQNFYSAVDTNNANYIWLQRWRSKPLKRISHDSGEILDGLNYWASVANTYYVECEPEQEAEKINANWRKLELVLKVAETLV
jgi:hypothetical protein